MNMFGTVSGRSTESDRRKKTLQGPIAVQLPNSTVAGFNASQRTTWLNNIWFPSKNVGTVTMFVANHPATQILRSMAGNITIIEPEHVNTRESCPEWNRSGSGDRKRGPLMSESIHQKISNISTGPDP